MESQPLCDKLDTPGPQALAPLKNYNNIRLELELALTFDLITFLLELESYVPLAFRCRMASKNSPMHPLHPLVPLNVGVHFLHTIAAIIASSRVACTGQCVS